MEDTAQNKCTNRTVGTKIFPMFRYQVKDAVINRFISPEPLCRLTFTAKRCLVSRLVSLSADVSISFTTLEKHFFLNFNGMIRSIVCIPVIFPWLLTTAIYSLSYNCLLYFSGIFKCTVLKYCKSGFIQAIIIFA